MPSFAKTLSALLAAAALTAGMTAAAQVSQDEPLQRLQLRHCSRLIWQFDNAVTRTPRGPTVERARAARAEGEKLCNRGKVAKALPMLEAALLDIGINPLPRP